MNKQLFAVFSSFLLLFSIVLNVAAVTPSYDLSSYAMPLASKTSSSDASQLGLRDIASSAVQQASQHGSINLVKKDKELNKESKKDKNTSSKKKQTKKSSGSISGSKISKTTIPSPQAVIQTNDASKEDKIPDKATLDQAKSAPIPTKQISIATMSIPITMPIPIKDRSNKESDKSSAIIKTKGGSKDTTDSLRRYDQSTPCQIAPTPPSNTLPRFDCIRISEPVIVGEDFTIEVTASDPDNDMSALTLGVAPYGSSDFMPQACPSDNSCTKTWTLNEGETGLHTYQIKAKNELNQLIVDSVMVNVLEEPTADRFIVRTASVEAGPYFEDEEYNYINPVTVSVRNTGGALLASQVGTPFATFNITANTPFVFNYTAADYRLDADNIYFDEELPACSSLGCTLTGDGFTTSCTYRTLTADFRCTLTSSSFSGNMTFLYKPTGDSLGDNVIRIFNPMYTYATPVVSALPTVTFLEGTNYTGFDLDAYVSDDDNTNSEITWTVSNTDYVTVTISPSHVITIRPTDPSFAGTDIVTFKATDPDGNFDSADMTITVTNVDDDVPDILLYSPTNSTISILEGRNQTFYIDVDDYEPDVLQLFWTIDDVVAAQQSLIFHYNATNGPSTHTLTATVSDGVNSDGHTWTVIELDTIPTANFSYTPDDIIAGFTQVDFTDLSIPAYDPLVNWSWNFGDGDPSTEQNATHIFSAAGTYDVSLTVTDSDGSTNTVTKTLTVRADDVLPLINSITVVPDPADQTTPVDITANVIDDSSVAGVIATVTSPSGFYVTMFPLPSIGGDLYMETFTNTAEVGVYAVDITATDMFGNNNTASTLFTINQLTGSGDSTTTILTPPDNATFTVGIVFDLNASISAAGGDLTDCEATVLFDGAQVSLVSGTPSQSLGDIPDGSTVDVNWQFSGLVPGSSNIDVFTTCAAGEQSADDANLVFIHDVTSPSVSNVTAVPLAVETGDSVDISALVMDDVAVDSVLIEVTYPDLSTTTIPAVDTGSGLHTATFIDTVQTGTYGVRILANDTANNLNDSETTTFYVVPVDGFGNVTITITTPEDNTLVDRGSAFTVDVTSTAVAGDVFDCAVSISFTNGSVLSTGAGTIPIGHVFNDDSVTTIIPVNATARGMSDILATTTCTIAADPVDTDIASNISVVLFVDNPPGINNVSIEPVSVVQSTPVDIVANITDDDAVVDVTAMVTTPSGLMNVTVPLTLDSSGLYRGTFPTTFEVGTYTITVTANDTIGQEANTTATFATTQMPGSGISLTLITVPMDGAPFDLGQSFSVNASVSAVDGDLSGCQANLLFSNDHLVSYSLNPVLGDIPSGSVARANWVVNSTYAGDVDITVLTTCAAGNQSFDTVTVTILPDLIAPMVQNVTATPFVVELLFPVTLSANVTDNVQVDSVEFQITTPDGTVVPVSPSVVGSAYSASFGFTDQEGLYTVRVVANDTSGNANDAETTTFFAVNPATVGVVSVALDDSLDNTVFNQSTVFDVAISANASDGDVFSCDVTLTASDPTVLTPVGSSFVPNITSGAIVVVHVNTNASGLGTSDLIADISCLYGGSAADTATNITVVSPPAPINQAPDATITSPSNDSIFLDGTQVNFTGVASDPEDGALTGASLEWFSDLDGLLGAGESLDVSTLSIGNHTITLVAMDSLGITGSDSIIVEIVPPAAPINAAPDVNITAPVNGSAFINNTQINFTGVGVDPEDGVLPDASLSWSSSLDGVLGTGSSLSFSTLSVGNHTITFTGVDSLGISASDSILIEILPTPPIPNGAPSVTLLDPLDNTQFNNTQTVVFTADVTDDFSSTLTCSLFVDDALNQSNGAVPNATSVSFTVTGLAYAPHTWRIECNDGLAAGVSETRSFTITDTLPPTLTIESPLDGSLFIDTAVPLTYTVTDAESGVNQVACAFQLDSGALVSLPSCTNTTVTTTAGGHALTVFVADAFGNTQNASVAFTVDLNATLTGFVLDNSTGLPIVGAFVQLLSGSSVIASTTSAADGNYTFTITAGDYNVSVAAVDYSSQVISVNMPVNTTTVLNVNLTLFQSTATFTGQVTDGNNTLYGATVELVQNGVLIATTTTNATGHYVISGLSVGDYNITIFKPGYTTHNDVGVTIIGGSNAHDDVLVQNDAIAGGLSGTVFDLTPAPIAGATVTVTRSDTGETVQVVIANADGVYQVNGLPVIFTYNLVASASGRVFVVGPTGVGIDAGTVTSGNNIFMT